MPAMCVLEENPKRKGKRNYEEKNLFVDYCWRDGAVSGWNGATTRTEAGAAAAAGNAGSTPENGNAAGRSEEDANLITIDDFAKVQMKVAAVESAERLEGSDKLLILKLDAGGEKRQVVSGIAKQYSPEEMIGKKVILITNLQSAVLRGVTSEGMILAATKGKKLVLLTVDGDIPAGAKIS